MKTHVLVLIAIVLLSGCARQGSGEIGREDCIGHCLPVFEEGVVWTEFVGENLLESIYLLDIETGMKSVVNSQPAHISALDKYGDRVVWVDDRKSLSELKGNRYKNWTMYMKDLSTGEEMELLLTPTSTIRVYGDRIVFIVDERDRTSMHMYDLDTGTKTELVSNIGPRGYVQTFTGGGSSCLDMYESHIVFKEYAGTPTIYLMDLETLTKTKIAEEPGNYASMTVGANCPSIDGNLVAYGIGNEEFTTVKINLYDITTGETTELTKLKKPSILGKIHGLSASDLEIHGDNVRYVRRASAWVGPDMDAPSWDCFLMDIISKEKTDITCEGGIPSYTDWAT